MKIDEKWFEQDGKLVQRKTFDHTPTIESAQALRSNGMTGWGENWHVGRIDKEILLLWAKEAGLTLGDTDEMGEVIKRKLLDGDFSKLRVHEGSF